VPGCDTGVGGEIAIGQPDKYGLGGQVSLHVYNLVEEMDAPGEYALEPGQKRLLVLLPKTGTSGTSLDLSWLGAPMVNLENASFVCMQGIRFTHGRSDGIRITNGSDIVIRRCSFDGLGATGVNADGNRIVVEDSLFERIGSMGVRLAGGDSKTLVHSDNRVAWCTFRDFSRLKRTYAPAISLGGVGAVAENCLMSDAPHSAILYGGQEHLIRNNEIHDVLTETGDCGAIYAGRSWTAFGTVISGNWIHDLKGTPGSPPCGIYLDDQLSGITVKGNLIERAPLGVLVGGGRYDQIEGNIVSTCQEGLHLDSRGTQAWSANSRKTLAAGLEKLPGTEEPWKSRYPQVQATLTDRPNLPVGTRIIGNALVGCHSPWHGTPATSGVAIVEPNWKSLPAPSLVERNGTFTITGTPLVFTKPSVGVRK